ncbi:MAG: DEAD/DEAH box helicase family protein [Prevotella sp.]|nr:DEAD/DEAH box helicase family protein [Prevotella sp.]MDD7029053.1 DEAD/DEAH box helicase family protein [Prevotellaceae bacterium]MDY5209321.1 DEAD/DEAH box helicase family protein [Prevotella sp.]
MKQLKYQEKAVGQLVENTINLLGFNGNRRQVVLKAPTGAGKTVMASEMLATLTEELQSRSDLPFRQVAFIWIAPNKLHQQSYFKMKNFFTETKLLKPVMFDELDQSDGIIHQGEVLFVNWESINSKNNLIVRDNEQGLSIYDIARKTREENIPIIVVIDEEHLFWTKTADKSKAVLEKINAKVEIRISATPKTKAEYLVNIDRQEVIREEMIKEGVLLNPDVTSGYANDIALNEHLINKALEKRQQIADAYKKEGVNINPLLLIQLPNDTTDAMTADDTKIMEQVVQYLDVMQGINTDNHRLAVWLSKQKTNLEDIERNDNLTEVLLFKQAIALGWDCPRAAVLLIFRKLTSDTFTVQTVGRILRMPEQRFYCNPLLNKGYVYTDISKDKIQIVADDMDYLHKAVLQAVRRNNLDNVQLVSYYEVRRSADRNRLGPDFRKVLTKTFEDMWTTTTPLTIPFLFEDEGEESDYQQIDVQSTIVKNRQSAERQRIRLDVKNVNIEIPADIFFQNDVNTTIETGQKAKFTRTAGEVDRVYIDWCRQMLSGYEKAHSTGVLANYLLEAMENLFELFETEAKKVVLYHENRPKFADVVSKALDRYARQLKQRQQEAKKRSFEQYEWEVPEDRTYTEENYVIKDKMEDHALLPFIELRTASTPEQEFALFLESHSDSIDWWYKNGDSGREHYAVAYTNSQGDKSLFYVDFVIKMNNGQVFLFDTKTENSDPDAPQKHNALLDYMQNEENSPKHLQGGIIIHDINHSGNWLYSPQPIDNTYDTQGWDAFFPDMYK